VFEVDNQRVLNFRELIFAQVLQKAVDPQLLSADSAALTQAYSRLPRRVGKLAWRSAASSKWLPSRSHTERRPRRARKSTPPRSAQAASLARTPRLTLRSELAPLAVLQLRMIKTSANRCYRRHLRLRNRVRALARSTQGMRGRTR